MTLAWQAPWWWHDITVLTQIQVWLGFLTVALAIIAVLYARAVALEQFGILSKQSKIVEDQLRQTARQTEILELDRLETDAKLIKSGKIELVVSSLGKYGAVRALSVANGTEASLDGVVVSLNVVTLHEVLCLVDVDKMPDGLSLGRITSWKDQNNIRTVHFRIDYEHRIKPHSTMPIAVLKTTDQGPVGGSISWEIKTTLADVMCEEGKEILLESAIMKMT